MQCSLVTAHRICYGAELVRRTDSRHAYDEAFVSGSYGTPAGSAVEADSQTPAAVGLRLDSRSTAVAVAIG